MLRYDDTRRIASIDLFRALTMLVMLFVNDFAGIGGIPHWLGHAETQEDMMGFSDLVFPAFLFCMGLSVPFSVRLRIKRSWSKGAALLHFIFRSLSLIVMGLFAMNCSSVTGGLPGTWFKILMVIGFFLLWNKYPEDSSPKRFLYVGIRAVGAALLTFLAVHRLTHGHEIVIGWWGILGLIGWAYLFCSLVYFCLHRYRMAVYGMWLVTAALAILSAGAVPSLGFYPGGWTHVCISFSGVVVSTMMSYYERHKKPFALVPTLLNVAFVMLLLGIASHRFWIISKNLATPTWMFYSLCASVSVFAVLYLLADILGANVLNTGFGKVALLPAGTATLTCFTVPTLTYAVRQLLHLSYPHVLSYGYLGLAKSLVFAFVIVILCGLLSRAGIRLKL